MPPEKTIHLAEYANSLKEIKELSRQMKISDEHFRKIYKQCIHDVYRRPRKSRLFRSLFVLVIILLGVLFFNYEGTCSIILCNIQECIYPGLKMLRKFSIPIIRMFPSLTDFYDESCLIPNPYFHVVDMDCWPCHSVDSVVEVRDPVKHPLLLFGEPYIYKSNQNPVSTLQLQNMYRESASVFNRDAAKILRNNVENLQVGTILRNISVMNIQNTSYVWRMNRIGPAQALRKLFPRPAILPRLGLSTERFLLIEGGGTDIQWKIPDPECNNVYLLQGYGERLIEIFPVNECIGHCKMFTFLLQQSHALIYNWWYWRPVSRSLRNNNSTSVIYMGSYC